MSITVSGLSKQYGIQKAVDNISFSIGKGAIVGFLGPNGAGKSTTMKMITGYLQPDQGHVEVGGLPVSAANIAARQLIGYLPESNPLYFDLYVREYLAFMAGVHGLQQPAARINEIIQLVGLTPEAHKKLGQLSKGYKQRVGLAAALIHDPQVLILDEPTTGLDPNQILEIRDVIRALGKEKTILFSSHIMQEVAALCERVIIINKGRIVADDNIHQLSRRSADLHHISIRFKEPVDMSIFENLGHCNKVSTTTDHGFLLETSQPDALRNELMQLSMNRSLNIISMQTATIELEEIFKTLTQEPS